MEHLFDDPAEVNQAGSQSAIEVASDLGDKTKEAIDTLRRFFPGVQVVEIDDQIIIKEKES